MNNEKINKLNNLGNQVYFNAENKLDFESVIKSCLGSDTYRGFHRIDKSKAGAGEVFKNILKDNKEKIIETLTSIKEEKELDDLINCIGDEIKLGLKANVDSKQLKSFNKIRKPLDIFFEHLISMGKDIEKTTSNIIQFLFLPLDSQMFQSCFVFEDEEIKKLKLSRNFTFKDIESKEQYEEIQIHLKDKALCIGLRERIFFDLIWNDRYLREGKNLIETNPKYQFEYNLHY